MTDKERIEWLRNEINEHNRRYYVENSPSISDYEFDMLMKELISLEKIHPSLASEDSPTRHVGSDLDTAVGGSPVKEFARMAHRFPMLSLGNTYNVGEIEEFASRASKNVKREFDYCCELKFDGTAICLTYENSVLVRALTRGDGTYGDDVTANVRNIKSIPQKLHGDSIPSSFEIRGEIYMPYKAFDSLCKEREIDGDQAFANPRNAASGSLKLLDSKEVAHRGLECTLYHLLGDDLPFRTHDEALLAARSWGLPVSDHRRICKNIEEIENFISYWDDERKHLPFATDGIVIKINQLDIQKELGFTSKVPRWAVAYKFKAEQALAQVLSFDYQVGRTGAVTPVANLTPVPLSGSTIKRATLHNEEQMKLLDIRVGDWVYVEKGGEVIPKITSVELSKRPMNSARPEFPVNCPDCGTKLVRAEGEAKWFCPNTLSCPTQARERLVQFLSRNAMNVLGVADASVAAMYDLGIVRVPADFYELDRKALSRLDGWKDKSCERFFKSLKESRKVSFEHVLFALGIRNVGETTAKTLARHFGSLDSLMRASKKELQQVGDIGETIAGNIIQFFSDPNNLDNIRRLKEAGLQFSILEKNKADSILDGLTIVISGTYGISRDQMKELVEAHSGKVSGSVSSKTSYLLAGANPGPEKIKKAEELGVRIISEEEFYNIIGENPSENAEKELTLFDYGNS